MLRSILRPVRAAAGDDTILAAGEDARKEAAEVGATETCAPVSGMCVMGREDGPLSGSGGGVGR